MENARESKPNCFVIVNHISTIGVVPQATNRLFVEVLGITDLACTHTLANNQMQYAKHI